MEQPTLFNLAPYTKQATGYRPDWAWENLDLDTDTEIMSVLDPTPANTDTEIMSVLDPTPANTDTDFMSVLDPTPANTDTDFMSVLDPTPANTDTEIMSVLDPTPANTDTDFRHQVEEYHPGGRDIKYFRYVYWVQNRRVCRHICGGNIFNAIARSRAIAVSDAIAQGRSPQEIERMLSGR